MAVEADTVCVLGPLVSASDPEQGTRVVEPESAIEITPDTVAEAVASLVGANIASIE